MEEIKIEKLGSKKKMDLLEEINLEIENLSKFIKAIEDEVSIAILFLAKNGIKNSRDAIKKIGINQKKYYKKINELTDIGLLEKRDREYILTFFGNFFLKLVFYLENIIKNKDKLEFIDKTLKSKEFSENQKIDLTKVTLSDFSYTFDLREIFGVSFDSIYSIYLYDDLVKITKKLFDDAKEKIYIASQIIEPIIIEAGFKAIERGVKINGIINKIDNWDRVLKLFITIITNPLKIKFLYEFLKSRDFKLVIYPIPFTFVISDINQAVFVITSPDDSEFIFAILIKDVRIIKTLLNVFNYYWEKGLNIQEVYKI